ncbi:MAG: MurR/RpiR family transcriptional regulator [Lachnospiraceae bacterium]|jgi:RpiR family carbohydrate utilization transcriptional regulator|nr:MurR/RpiR family transcriptional regulator [Lachnospiraceae bacterium]RKJ51925.1 MurR/RpiR family transcriptional regulator [bacterium 1XD42-54]
MEKSVLETIRSEYSKLPMAERKIADFILEHPTEINDKNVSQLAKLGNVSDATVVRFCKHLGYKGFHQFAIFLANDNGKIAEERKAHEELLKSEDSVSSIIRRYTEEIFKIRYELSSELLETCADLIRSSTFVHIIAVGNTNPLAQYMHFKMERLGVRSTAEISPEGFLNQVNLAGKSDVVLAISQSGSSKQVVEGVRLAKKRGIKAIAITTSTISPLSVISDYILSSGGGHATSRYHIDSEFLKIVAVIDLQLEFVMNYDKINSVCAFAPEEILSDNKF